LSRVGIEPTSLPYESSALAIELPRRRSPLQRGTRWRSLRSLRLAPHRGNLGSPSMALRCHPFLIEQFTIFNLQFYLLRGLELHQRSPAYGAGEILLLYPALSLGFASLRLAPPPKKKVVILSFLVTHPLSHSATELFYQILKGL
jgi:hypothetical protein